MFSKLTERFTYFFFVVEEDWEIGVTETSMAEILNTAEISGIKWFLKKRRFFQADPFGVFQNNMFYIFYEQFDRVKNYGTINCKILNTELQQIDDRTIIDDGTHISFPFVFFYNGEYYLLPETFSKGRLILYKAEQFPFVWIEMKTILNEPCTDSVLFDHDGKWWLIYTKAHIENENGVLFLRCSDDIFGDWDKCEEILIQNGNYNSRNAGTPHKIVGKIFRPTQNCAYKYGESVVINEITKLSFPNFEERIVNEIRLSHPYTLGFHTLSECGRLSLVDGIRRRLYRKPLTQIIRQIYRKVINV